MKRASGVLLHATSLGGDYSIGSFGKEARDFIDLLADCGFSLWQVLPFCMADSCNSPYQSYSAFGGNPYLIDLPTLFDRKLLTEEELSAAKQESPYLCEYDRLAVERLPLLRRAAERVKATEQEEIADFMATHKELCDAARFLALREKNGEKPWQEWTETEPDAEELFFWQFVQYEFYRQWQSLKAYANERGISVIGDVPIYVSLDSCDVWANPEQFQLDREHYPTAVAGVPPDYFSEDGQLWRNPLYDWKQMKKDGYAWWCRRIEYMLTLFDGVRIDHFRGLSSYWSVPADAETAKEGKWIKGPSRALIDKLRAVAGDRLIIAEDLGDITPDVSSLLAYSKFPGMRVLQFAFLGDPETPHLPHNYEKNCVAYTGTHDNNTLFGYVWECDPETRKRIFSYCNYEGEDWNAACVAILKTMLGSHANTVIFPIQDLLVYGADTRMNTPGKAKGNWQFRITKKQLDAIDRKKMRELLSLYGRN